MTRHSDTEKAGDGVTGRPAPHRRRSSARKARHMAPDDQRRNHVTNEAAITPSASIPAAPGSLPVLGNLLPLLRDPVGFLASLPAHGDLVRVRVGGVSLVVVCSPDLAHQVLLDDRTFDKGGPFMDSARKVAPANMLTSRRTHHRRLRRLTQPAFHHDRFPGYARTMTAQIGAMVDSWQDNQVLDVLDEMLRFTMKVTLDTMFSSALSPQDMERAMADITVVLAGVFRQTVTPAWLNRIPTPGNRRYRQALAGMRRLVETIIAKHGADGTGREDLLSALRAAHEPASEEAAARDGLTDSEIADQLILFIVAGSETAAITLAWALHLLACHPAVAERLRAEVDSVLAGGVVTAEHLPRLEFTRCVVLETLRLYSPTWISTRIVTKDVRLGEYLLRANTNILLAPHLVHYRSDLYLRPESFDPGRWTSPNARPAREAFLPFASGPRKCLGDNFALTEVTLALAGITARWRLQHLPGQEVRAVAKTTLRPNGLRMRAGAVPHNGFPLDPASS